MKILIAIAYIDNDSVEDCCCYNNSSTNYNKYDYRHNDENGIRGHHDHSDTVIPILVGALQSRIGF